MKRFLLLFSLFIFCSFYAQNDTLSIIRHSDNDLVIPKKKKIFFRGLKNEIIVDVPNCKSFKVTGEGLTLINKKLYDVKPGNGSEVIITIDIFLKNNKKVTEKHIFEIRNIGSFISCFNFIRANNSVITVSKEKFKNAVISVISPDKNLNMTFKVVQFYIKIPGRTAIIVNGEKIDEKTFKEINTFTSRGEEIVISNIAVMINPPLSGFLCIKTAPMVIKVL